MMMSAADKYALWACFTVSAAVHGAGIFGAGVWWNGTRQTSPEADSCVQVELYKAGEPQLCPVQPVPVAAPVIKKDETPRETVMIKKEEDVCVKETVAVSKPPRRAETPRCPGLGRSGEGVQNAASGGFDEWALLIRKRIERAKYYPSGASDRRARGTVTVSFCVRSDGFADDISVARGSGCGVLDSCALDIVKKASPYPLPKEPGLIDRVFSVSLVFTPDERRR